MDQLCVACGAVIPSGRLKALPGTKVCVNCSTAGRKKAVTVVGGEGEDTFNDIVIMDDTRTIVTVSFMPGDEPLVVTHEPLKWQRE